MLGTRHRQHGSAGPLRQTRTTPTAISSRRSGPASLVDDDQPGLEARGLWRAGDQQQCLVRAHRRVAHRDRPGPSAHAAGGSHDGHRRQQGRAFADRDDQGRRACHGLQGDRLGNSGPWGGGTNNDLGLSSAYATARLLRLADGPDEVHRNQIAQLEIRRHQNRATRLPGFWTEVARG